MRRYSVIKTAKPGGFRHEILWLESANILIDFSRDHGVRIQYAWQSNVKVSRAERIVIAGALLSDHQLIDRACRLAALRRYHVARYNCEHFIRELVGAKLQSPQVNALLTVAGVVGLGFVAARAAA